ncbi:MAG: protein kinase domain-containing protein [Methanobacteriota archaeon]
MAFSEDAVVPVALASLFFATALAAWIVVGAAMRSEARADALATGPPVPGERFLGRFRILGPAPSREGGPAYYAAHDRLPVGLVVRAFPLPRARTRETDRAVLAEARAATTLHHAYVARVYDVAIRRDALYVVEDRDAGRSVEDAVARARVPLLDAARLLDETLGALGHAHARRVPHGALSLARLRLGTDGHVRVEGFGLRRVLPAGGIRSPEETGGAPPTAASDLYACGVLFLEMLTGVRDARNLPAGTPAAVSAFLRRTLARDPVMRFGTAAEMRAALGAAVGRP